MESNNKPTNTLKRTLFQNTLICQLDGWGKVNMYIIKFKISEIDLTTKLIAYQSVDKMLYLLGLLESHYYRH